MRNCTEIHPYVYVYCDIFQVTIYLLCYIVSNKSLSIINSFLPAEIILANQVSTPVWQNYLGVRDRAYDTQVKQATRYTIRVVRCIS